MRSNRHPIHVIPGFVGLAATMLAGTGSPALAQSQSLGAAPGTTATAPIPALLPLAVQFDISSAATGRTYRITVSKPVVPPPPTGYAVLYVLDGDSAFATAQSQAVLASALDGRKPIVVVGIGYPDVIAGIRLRNRDLTPYVPDAETAGMVPADPEEWGGADAFHTFMTTELRPKIDGIVAVDKSDQSLMGYSLGGLFALHVLLTSPTSYKNYVIGSPSIWWNGKQVLRDLPSFSRLVQNGEASPRILITAAELEQSTKPRSLPQKYRMVDNARELAESLARIRGRPGYHVEYALFANEEHNAGIPASTSRGVGFVESGSEAVGR